MTSECLDCNNRDHESNMVYQVAGGFLCHPCHEVRCKTALHESQLNGKNKSDMVNHPSHYQGKGLECIQVIKAFELGFNLGNAIKYILRADKKGLKKQDLQKAVWYLTEEIGSIDEK
jgi:hypothetical protein